MTLSKLKIRSSLTIRKITNPPRLVITWILARLLYLVAPFKIAILPVDELEKVRAQKYQKRQKVGYNQRKRRQRGRGR